MNDRPKTKPRWRLLRWGLIGLAGLATLAAILVTEENWRGKRDLENFKHAAEARGERFDWMSMEPSKIPDDQNFLAAPMVLELLTNGATFNIYRGDASLWPTRGGNWQKSTLTDLTEWQTYFRKLSTTPAGKTNGFPVSEQPQTPATDVLLALSIYDSVLEALREASQRSGALWPFNYENGFEDVGTLMPPLAGEKRAAQFLQLRILAEIQANQTGPALTDTKLFLRLIDSLRSQPFLISHLVAIAMQAIAIQPIYEGLALHRWNDAQLADLQTALAAKDYLADFQFAMRGERTFAIAWMENQRITGKYKTVVFNEAKPKEVTINMRLMPNAFFYQNELAIAQMYQQYILPLVDPTNRLVIPSAVRSADASVQAELNRFSPYKIQARMLFPAISKAVQKFATIQAQVDLARVACALERFRLAHGNYPESLDALAPQFIEKLPHDIINGQPLHYRRTDDGQFVLYSVGWDEKDDGGQIIADKNGRVGWEKGDWVWRYPKTE
jgi:hypothetical protein